MPFSRKAAPLLGLTTLAALGLMAAPAHAQLLLTESTSQSGGNTLYSFSATLGPATPFDNGGFFTIYDLPGTPSGATAPTGFSASTQLVGKNSAYTAPLPSDNPGQYNVTFTNTGTTFPRGVTSTALGTFTFQSNQAPTAGQVVPYIFTATDTSTGGGINGDFYTSSSAVPLAQPAVTATPEPSSVAAFGFTALGVGGLMLRARKRRVTG